MAADPFTPWLKLWNRSTQIAVGAPEVVAHRLHLFCAPWPWTPSTVIESQQMVWEKMLTAGEMWWTLWMGVWSPAALLGSRGWDGRYHPHALHAMHRALEPVSSRVNANVRRLRRG